MSKRDANPYTSRRDSVKINPFLIKSSRSSQRTAQRRPDDLSHISSKTASFSPLHKNTTEDPVRSEILPSVEGLRRVGSHDPDPTFSPGKSSPSRIRLREAIYPQPPSQQVNPAPHLDADNALDSDGTVFHVRLIVSRYFRCVLEFTALQNIVIRAQSVHASGEPKPALMELLQAYEVP
jgi:hypothetical protein